jgi:hypothetical protein
MSGLLHVAIWPGGQGDGSAGLSIAAAGIAAAGAGAGDRAGIAAVAAGIGGNGSGMTIAGARARKGAGAGAGAPVMLGARAIGPGAGSTAAGGGPVSTAAGGGSGSTGAHPPSQSGIAVRLAANHASRFRRTLWPGFTRRAVALSSVSGIGVSPRRRFRLKITLSRARREQHASAAHQAAQRRCNLGRPGKMDTRLLRFVCNPD